MENGQYVDGSLFFYAPNKGAAIFSTVLFAASAGVHLYQTLHYRCKLLTFLIPFCALLFTVGFALRCYGAWHYTNLNVYIASICITYAAPPLLELQNYRILGRILYYVPYNSPIHPGRVLTTFGFISAIVEALNGWGASYSANRSLTDSQIAAGHALIKTSLIIQIFVAVAFIALAVTFHRRCSKAGIHNVRLHTPLVALYCSTALITIRTIYRIVEYFSFAQINWNDTLTLKEFSPIIRYEWFFYVFEVTVMAANLIMWNIFHPRRFLPKSNKIYLAVDGVTEIKGPGLKDDRPFWRTLVDPFDLDSLIRGGRKGMQMNKFWETHQEGGPGSEHGPKSQETV